MKVSVAFAPLTGLPAPIGAHELVWSYLLDTVMADAYTRELAVLHIALPQMLAPALSLRIKLSAQVPQTGSGNGATGAALFDFGHGSRVPEDATRLYTLAYGKLASFTLRRTMPPSGNWHLAQRLSIYCLSACLWGGLIRLANLLGKRALSDWAMHRMRRSFASSRRHLALYQLTIWERV